MIARQPASQREHGRIVDRSLHAAVTEAVHVHLRHPVLQALDDEPGDEGVIAVDGVAAARVVPVAAAIG